MSTNLKEGVGVGIAFLLLTLALEPLLGLMEKHLGAGGTSLVWITGLFFFLTGVVPFRHYVALLGAGGEPRSSAHRKAYEDLRESLSDEGTPARIYAAWLEKALRMVEHFFGDAGLGAHSVMARVLGLTRSEPLWTAPALDRCILLVFIYPQSMVLLIWMTSGQVGPAEAVLGLLPHMAPWQRAAAILGIAVAFYGYCKSYKYARLLGTKESSPRKQTAGKEETESVYRMRFFLWFTLATVPGGLVGVAVLGHSSAALGGAIGVTSSLIGAAAGDVLIAFAATLASAVIGAIVLPLGGTIIAAIVSCLGGSMVGLGAAATPNHAWNFLRDRLRRSGVFLSLFLAAAVIACLAATYLLSSTPIWPLAGPIILFYGLLSALNAPFLWFSVGLTRTLLWLGLERKGWWPYFYALIDAAMAVLTVVILVIVMVVGIQTLDRIAIASGGHAVLSLLPSGGKVELLDAIRDHPAAPQFWWAYALLLSTMIPSMVNLTIGGLSLVRGIPLLSRHLHTRLPKGRAVPVADRGWIAFVLMGQWMIGIGLGVLAQAFLVWGIFGHFLPGIGTGVLQVARSIALYDLPAHAFHFFGR